MSADAIAALISGAGCVLSIMISTFIAGLRTGEMKGDMKALSKDIAEIKGMFVLRLRDDADQAVHRDSGK